MPMLIRMGRSAPGEHVCTGLANAQHRVPPWLEGLEEEEEEEGVQRWGVRVKRQFQANGNVVVGVRAKVWRACLEAKER